MVNAYNENQDYYYIKKADASRIYGLRVGAPSFLPTRMHYLIADDLLVEEHSGGGSREMSLSSAGCMTATFARSGSRQGTR